MADYKFDPKYATPEQLAYAKLLDVGWKIGFVLTVILFFLYTSGIMPGYVPLEELPNYWSLSAEEFRKTLNTPVGWNWVELAGKGDYLNFIGIAWLAAVTIFCFLRVLPLFLAKGDKVYSAIIALEVLVLVLAASGVLVGGAH